MRGLRNRREARTPRTGVRLAARPGPARPPGDLDDAARPSRRRKHAPRRIRATALVACALLTSAACSISGGGGSAPDKNPTESPTAGTGGLTVPPGFAADRGWTVDERARVFAVAPESRKLLDVWALGDTVQEPADGNESPAPPEPTVLFARAMDTGAVVWNSAPLQILADQGLPVLRVLDTSAGEYAVVMRVGTIPGTGMAKDRRVVAVDAYPVVSSGNAVEPVRHIERDVPEGTTEPAAVTVIGDGEVYFPGAAGEDENGDATSAGELWDPMTGIVTPVIGNKQRGFPLVPSAAGVLTVTAAEDCYGMDSDCPRTVSIPGKWTAKEHKYAMPVAVTGSAVVIAWWDPSDADEPLARFAVHDLLSGQLLMSADCPRGEFDEASNALLAQRPVASTNGRYLAYGQVAFDLSARTAKCLSGDARVKGIVLSSMSDSGVAYGKTNEEVPSAVTVRMSDWRTEVLPFGVSAPEFISGGGTAVFVRRGDDPKGEDQLSLTVCPPT